MRRTKDWNEAQWLSARNPLELMFSLIRKTSDRKYRLFVLAWTSRWTQYLLDERSRRAIRVAGEFIEGLAGAGELASVRRSVRALFDEAELFSWRDLSTDSEERKPQRVAWLAGCCAWTSARRAALAVASRLPGSADARMQLPLLRDIFGNPFCPAVISPEWLTPTVTAVAGSIYANQHFEDLPILGDALEDAGCTNSQLLDHCRGPGPHVRGCFVVDLLLGKS